LRDGLREARGQLATRLDQLHPGWPPGRSLGVATVIVAAIDGLMLHHMIDGELPVDEALAAAELLLPGEGS
ncbi:MAG: TetR/AcrR family transcriptional regulator, partial [Nonomuraea sp.]|nr:TetR/AcrR family transcriptional regulator [Nonomuraea sp.]